MTETPSRLTDGPDHRAVPTATQSLHPMRAVIRTVVAVGIPAFLTFAALVPEIVQTILDGLGRDLPEGFRLGMLAVAAGVTTAAGILTRIMAIPGLVEWTRKYLPWLSPDKQ